jgi:hypothetical protein
MAEKLGAGPEAYGRWIEAAKEKTRQRSADQQKKGAAAAAGAEGDEEMAG